MGEVIFALNEAVFTYLIAPQPDEQFERHTAICNDRLVISHTAKTDVIVREENSCEVAIIGYCIDAHGELARADIPSAFLSQNIADPLSAYRYFDRFAGAYVVFYRRAEQIFMWGDAMCSLPINYCLTDDAFCTALTDKLAADFLHLEVSEVSLKIRKGSSVYSQPLPNDLTMYDEIKALLPNHYLDCVTRKAVRVPLGVCETSEPNDFSAIVDVTAALAENISAAYQRDFDLAVPLTAGTDSRTVLSFFKKDNPAVPCFTYKHAAFTDETADIAIPTKICDMCHLPYQAIVDLKAPPEWGAGIASGMGPYLDETEVDNVYTYCSYLRGKAHADGSIIDEVGKSTQENSVPVPLLNVPFFMCKLHNYERATKQEMRKYIDNIVFSGEKKHLADLFAMEQKLGRRVSQGMVLYALCGVPNLSLFNCREIILQWTRIPRKIRVNKYLPYELIRRNDARLLDIPFNPGGRLIATAKKSWIVFYAATFVKYFLTKYRSFD